LGCGPGIYSELLYDKGFSDIGVFDDVTGADFTGKSETICGIFKAV